MVIHDAEAVAVHEQPVSVSTLKVPVVASLEIDVVTGESAYVQVWPACVTVKVWPPAVIVPVRELVPGFAATR
jgi:hypothetical protein